MSISQTGFINQLDLVEQLISIHGYLQEGRGRRHEQDALHRAGVVLTVAAWQAYIEKVICEALEILDSEMRNPADPSPQWAIHTFRLRRASILNAVKKFNTPDDVKVRDLFQDSFGFSPWASWEWRSRRRQWSEQETRRRTNTWVLVRHSIAHGFSLPADVDWLKGSNGQARLTLNLLNECKKHFTYLVEQTDIAFADHLVTSHNIPRPW
jgi:hypothetical protein